MSDRPKPGKDKDLRYIRNAIDDADEVYRLLSSELVDEQTPGVIELISEAMLLVIEQFDQLNQMLDDATIPPTAVIEHNRCLRSVFKLIIKEKLSAAGRVVSANIIQLLGSQFRSLLVTKEIRGVDDAVSVK